MNGGFLSSAVQCVCMTVMPRAEQKRNGRKNGSRREHRDINPGRPEERSGRIRAHGTVWWLLTMM